MSAAKLDEILAAAVAAVGGSSRQGQRDMAEAVETAIEKDRHLLVQAGTGTGKSLAYIVPAAAHAVATGSPVVISTATLALQAQIVERDLPRMSRAMAPILGRPFTWQLVKGRFNYLCRNKVLGGYPVEDEPALFDLGAPASEISPLGADIQRLREWAEETTTGDRDELVPGVSDRAWRQVAVTASECLGQRCPVIADCHSELSRAAAFDADLIVSNHAFVSIDAFEGRAMLPEHDVVIFDEGHEIVDRVTSVTSEELTPGMVLRAATRARKMQVDSSPALDSAADDLTAALELSPEGMVEGLLEDGLAVVVAAIRDAARAVLTELAGQRGGDDVARHLAKTAVNELYECADRISDSGATAAVDRHDVLWVSATPRPDGGVWRALHIAPMSVAGLVREKLFREKTVVVTSATLTLGGDFRSVAAGLGLLGEDAPPYDTLDVGSPFDYTSQGMLYVAGHLPPPGRDGTSVEMYDELEALIRAAGGRTLGLFSSRRAALAATEEMRARLDLPILCQGEDQTATLVREFSAEPPSCLFGTLTLWQGVDVPGDACQLVVIDRIPFPRPDDPLSMARSRAVARAGGNGFMQVSAAHAALLLAQGAGRLIRSMNDRGVVAVLDSRLANARYAGYLRSSMPPFWATTNPEHAKAALKRLRGAADASEG